MGTRALLDTLLIEKVGDVGSFAEKLDALEEQGFIGRMHRDQLEAALDVGSAAAHRGVTPSEASLGRAIDIVENLLETIHVLDQAAIELKRETPPRIRTKRL